MAENKGTMLAKSVQKHAGRAKEKILQNLGKVDRTADEIFDDHLNNFNRQQLNANRLQKEFNNYIRCIRAAQTASKSLMDAIAEIYEPQWSGYDALQAQAQASESLWQDFAHKLADQVLIPLNTYTGQFPEMKKKVEKRNRKLIDYDGQRHSFQSLQANANKRKDDVKLTKGREQLEEARRTYELLNTELHDELPALYDSRILFLVTNLQTLFATEQVFHNETAKIYSELEAIVDKLATESQRGSNTLRKTTVNAIKSASPVQSPVKQLNNANITNSNNQYQNSNGSANPPSPSSSSTQESRLVDNVSRTSESNAADKLLGGSTVVEQHTTTITAAATAPANNIDKSIATNETAQLSSPNANNAGTTATAVTTTTSTIEETTIKSPPTAKTTNTTEESKITEITTTTVTSSTTKEDVDMNNTTIDAPTAAATVTAKSLAATEVEGALKKSEQVNGNVKDTANGNVSATTTATNNTTTNGNANTDVNTIADRTVVEDDNNAADHANKTQLDATTTDLPPGVLYRVKATYGYVKEDVDELSFEVGDIIRVIEYDDPEDQEEGWLMGEKEGTNEKGLFPANFTRPI